MILCLLSLPSFGDDGNRYATNSLLSSGKWVKIKVEKSGVYQISRSSLRSMGFSNPENVKLYGLNMEVLPETGLEKLDDDMVEIPLYRTDDKVLFYGRGLTRWTLTSSSSDKPQFTHFNNPYSTNKYYFLTEGTEPKEFSTYNYEVINPASISTFPDYSLIETDAYSFLNSGRVFFDSYDFVNGNSKNYTLSLPGVKSGTDVTLDVQFCAAGSTSSSLSVSMNGNEVGTLTFGRLGSYDYGRIDHRSYQISEGVSESNTINLTHNRSSGISGHLDYIQASYIRSLSMSGNELLFRPIQNGQVRFQLSGASEGTVVWRVSRGTVAEGVSSSYNDGVLSIDFESDDSGIGWQSEELVALNPGATFPSPTVVGEISNQDLHSLGNLDLVIVVPTSGRLTGQAQRLADAHLTYDSLHSVVVRADEIYNEFSGGTPDATAIRRFMKMLYDNGTSSLNRPKNLLLFGDGVWDNRMVTSGLKSFNADDYLLCYESDNSLSHTNSYVLEEYYALVDDDAPSDVLWAYPRFGVGRIPVVRSTEAKEVVDKLIKYISNSEVGAWKNTLCFICDDGNNNIHMEDGEAVIGEVEKVSSDYMIKRIYLDTYQRETSATGSRYPGVEQDIDKLMQDGALVVNYTGHGGHGGMTHELTLVRSDFEEWNSTRLPLWVTAACDIAPFDMNAENCAEAALLNPVGAAMGFVGTARTVYSGPNRDMNKQYMKYVLSDDEYGRQYSIGEALSLSKCALIKTRSNEVNRAHFVLIGDPAITLASPRYKVVVDKINGKSTENIDLEGVYAGESVTVSGHIEDRKGLKASDFRGYVYPTILDNEEEVVCNNNSYGETNGNTEDEPYRFNARIRTLYTLVDSVSGGEFTFKFPIPLDNNYSGKSGEINVYAATEDHKIESHGTNEQFYIQGTSPTLSTDTIGPEISPVYLNTTEFQNGDVVNETPYLVAHLHDDDGINMTGSGIGHDIIAMIDNNESTTYSLNSYFTPTVSDYTRGSVAFSIPALSDGPHTLTLRAFDILNNPSTSTIEFYVNNGEKPKIFSLTVNSPVSDQALFTIENDRPQTDLNVSIYVYDIGGRLVYQTSESHFSSESTYTFTWNLNESGSHLVPGIYIVKAGISTSDGPQATEAEKFIVIRH